MEYVSDKDKKPLTADLETIYGAVNEVKIQEQLKRSTEKWQKKYPNDTALLKGLGECGHNPGL